MMNSILLRGYPRKKINSIVYRISNEIKGEILCKAFIMAKNEGISLRVNKLNDEEITPQPSESDHSRINVNVVNGVIQTSWIG